MSYRIVYLFGRHTSGYVYLSAPYLAMREVWALYKPFPLLPSGHGIAGAQSGSTTHAYTPLSTLAVRQGGPNLPIVEPLQPAPQTGFYLAQNPARPVALKHGLG